MHQVIARCAKICLAVIEGYNYNVASIAGMTVQTNHVPAVKYCLLTLQTLAMQQCINSGN